MVSYEQLIVELRKANRVEHLSSVIVILGVLGDGMGRVWHF